MTRAFQNIIFFVSFILYFICSSPLFAAQGLFKCAALVAAAGVGLGGSFLAGQEYNRYQATKIAQIEKLKADEKTSAIQKLNEASKELENEIQKSLKQFLHLNSLSKDLLQKPADQWLPSDAEIVKQMIEWRSRLLDQFQEESNLSLDMEAHRLSLRSQVQAAQITLQADQASYDRLLSLAKQAEPRLQTLNQYLELLKVKGNIDKAIEKIEAILARTSDSEKSEQLKAELEKLKSDREELQSQINESLGSSSSEK